MTAARRPRLRFRRIGVKVGRLGFFSTLDLGRTYINFDICRPLWPRRWWPPRINFYVGGRYVR